VEWANKQAKTDYLLLGQLQRLDEIDYGGGVHVEVKLSAQVIDLRNKSAVWSGTQTETAKVEKAAVNSVVIEMRYATQRCIDRLIADMQDHFVNHHLLRLPHTLPFARNDDKKWTGDATWTYF